MSRITGTGFYVPANVVTNDQISDSNLWIVNNTGIKERRISSKTSSFLGTKAAEKLGDCDVLIVATATPDKKAPSTASIIKKELGLTGAAFDINAVCAGFIYALALGDSLIERGADKVMIIGVDTFSFITDWKRRDCIFFGDGAGAVMLEKGNGFKSFFIGSDSKDTEGFFCDHNRKFHMEGRKVYSTALRLIPAAVRDVLQRADMTINDIDYMVPHQPSKRILIDVAKEIGIPEERVLMNMDKYANTSAGTIPILLAENWNKFKEGDNLLFAAIGSGWTYGAAIYEV